MSVARRRYLQRSRRGSDAAMVAGDCVFSSQDPISDDRRASAVAGAGQGSEARGRQAE